ncbi:MAG: SgcJ/EcaC family oxidoreductase [Propionibacteriaceae bacterium]
MQQTNIQQGIQQSFDRMTAAWDAGDADAFAAEFTEDASYVIYVGLTYFGRAAIRDAHVPVFEKWQKGSRLSMTVLDIRVVADGVAVVTTEGGLGKGRSIKHDKVQTYVMVDTDDGWRCAAFQNTKKNRLFIAANRWSERRQRPR